MVLCFGNYFMNIQSLKQLEVDTTDEKMEEKNIKYLFKVTCGCLEVSPRMELLCIPMAEPLLPRSSSSF